MHSKVYAMLAHGEFTALEESLQAVYLWADGTYLTSRQDDDFKINLYHLYGFFVEVWYDTVSVDIALIRSFTDTDFLGFYFDEINLDDLMNGGE